MKTAVLLSGGLDSAVLLAEEAARDEVQPIYVSVGLAWEASERAMVACAGASGPLSR
jgi:7-cyano-7-deazaguanine synthase in queuosine biosynthesis